MYGLWYCMSLIRKEGHLREAIAFGYGNILSVAVKADAKVELRIMQQ